MIRLLRQALMFGGRVYGWGWGNGDTTLRHRYGQG